MSNNTNDEDLTLEKEYRYLLSKIRPLIQQLNTFRDARLCLLWLSKLDKAAPEERSQRNSILSKLCLQVENNKLEPPFNCTPPSGPLMKALEPKIKPHFESQYRTESSSEVSSDLYFVSPELIKSCSSSCRTPLYTDQKTPKFNLSNSLWKRKNLYSPSSETNSLRSIEEIDHSECLAIQQQYQERAKNDILVIQRYQQIIRNLITEQRRHLDHNKPEKLKKIRNLYESKIIFLSNMIQNIQEKNTFLEKQLKTNTEQVQEKDELIKERDDLRERLQQMEEESKNTATKLVEVQNENEAKINQLLRKLSETETKKREVEEQLRTSEAQHNGSLQREQNDLQLCEEMEAKYTQELASFERILEEKNGELTVIKEQMKNQCLRFENEIAHLKADISMSTDADKERRKVRFLKNRIRKLEQSRDNMAALFQAQIQQIVKKKDGEIAELEVQLKTKGVATVSSKENDMQKLLQERVNALESQYRQLLTEAESQSTKQHQLDLQVIQVLQKQLLSSGVHVDESEFISHYKKM